MGSIENSNTERKKIKTNNNYDYYNEDPDELCTKDDIDESEEPL